MKRCLILTFIALIVRKAGANCEQSFIIRSRAAYTLQHVVSMRGGAGPLNVKLTARATSILVLLQGCNNYLAPAQANEGFGFESNPVNLYYRRRAGMVMISSAILIWELVGGSSMTNAYGISLLPLVMELVRALVSGDARKIGLISVQEYPVVALYILVAYGCFSGTPYAFTLLEVLIGWKTLYGLFGMTMPKQFLDAYIGTSDNQRFYDASTKVSIRLLGASLLGQAVILACQLWQSEMEAAKAVGFAVISFFVCEIFLICNEFRQLKVKVGPECFWIAMDLIMIGTMAF